MDLAYEDHRENNTLLCVGHRYETKLAFTETGLDVMGGTD